MESILLQKGDYWKGLFHTHDEAQDQVLPVYLAIFAIAHAFQLALAVDALINRNTIQIIGLCLFNAAFLVYAIMQIQEVKSAFSVIGNPDHSISIYTLVVPAMIGATEICYAFLSWKLFKEFGWEIFKSLGADRKIKKMYLAYQIFICLCKFDVFFLFAFSLQFVLLVLKQNDIERWLTVAAAPVTLALLAAGFVAARREIKWLMGIFMGGCVLGMGYFAFKLFRIFQDTDGRYHAVAKSLTAFSVVSIIALTGTIFQASTVFGNFGKGLKTHMGHKEKLKTGKAEEAGYVDYVPGLHYQLESAKSSRMSID